MKTLLLWFVVGSLLLPAVGFASSEGEEIYEKNCAVCHDSGVAGAPKLGDKGAWKGRLAEGEGVMMETALHGEGAMPAKGGHPELSDAEIKAAVQYMMKKGK